MLKSLIEVPSVAHLNIQVPSFKMILILCSVFLDRVVHFGKNLGEQVKGRSPQKNFLIAVPYVAHLIAQVRSFNMNLIFSP